MLRLTVIAALAVARTIEHFTPLEAGIKWVNDVYVRGKKVCGILCEGKLQPGSDGLEYAIVGIGINLGATRMPEALSDKATSLANECGIVISPETFAAELLRQFKILCDEIEDSGIMEEYRRRSVLLGKPLQVRRGEECFAALAEDIDSEGALHVLLPDGTRRRLNSGEVSVLLNQKQ